MNISFIVYFHSSRLENLKQTLRFLEKRESELLDGELILVCQDACSCLETSFHNYRHLNLNESSYRKPWMCNTGVKEARNDLVVLLDSDRILPVNYFTRNSKIIRKGEFVTTKKLYWLKKPYNDEEINGDRLEKEMDYRSPTLENGKKNIFAGNTLMFRNDYLESGGMDETFNGYGYADNDMTTNILSKGFKAIYRDDEELHLWHPHTVSWKGSQIDRNIFKIQSATNALRYNKKWNLARDDVQRNLIKEIIKEKNIYPKLLWDQFQLMLGPKY